MGFKFNFGNILGIVNVLLPFIGNLMTIAESTGKPGADKKAAVIQGVETIVQAGAAVSTGGQAHTFEELQAAMPVISTVIDTAARAVKLINHGTGVPGSPSASEG